jgi:hypothetical protein
MWKCRSLDIYLKRRRKKIERIRKKHIFFVSFLSLRSKNQTKKKVLTTMCIHISSSRLFDERNLIYSTLTRFHFSVYYAQTQLFISQAKSKQRHMPFSCSKINHSITYPLLLVHSTFSKKKRTMLHHLSMLFEKEEKLNMSIG